MPLHAVSLDSRAEGVIPAHDGKLWITRVGYHGNQSTAIDALPTAFQGDEIGCFRARAEQGQAFFDIQTDRDQGLREIQLRLKPAARTLGLTLDDVARQVRSAFFGTEALRVQREREDIRVYVRLPESERSSVGDLEEYRIRTAQGGEVPLRAVADLSYGTSPSTIRRKDGQRILTVTARVNPDVVSGQEVNDALRAGVLPALQAADFRLGYQFGGAQQQQTESFGAIIKGFLLAMLVVYALLAVPFQSYVQPLIIMAAVPFGVIGAFIGHLLLGLPVGLLSMFGIIGLSGVVVNDSIPSTPPTWLTAAATCTSAWVSTPPVTVIVGFSTMVIAIPFIGCGWHAQPINGQASDEAPSPSFYQVTFNQLVVPAGS